MGAKKLTEEKLLDYRMDFEVHNRPMLEDAEDLDLVHEISGKIIYQPGDRKSVIGTIRGHRIDVGESVNRRASLFDACDADSQELCNIYETLFDVKSGSVREDLALESFGDILAIHEISIMPKHRGYDLGLVALLQTIKTMGGGCSAAVLKPFPLQFAGKVNKENEKEFSVAQEKLRDHWCRLGFEPVEGSDLYIVDLALQMPTAAELLGLVIEA